MRKLTAQNFKQYSGSKKALNTTTSATIALLMFFFTFDIGPFWQVTLSVTTNLRPTAYPKISKQF